MLTLMRAAAEARPATAQRGDLDHEERRLQGQPGPAELTLEIMGQQAWWKARASRPTNCPRSGPGSAARPSRFRRLLRNPEQHHLQAVLGLLDHQ